MNIFYHQERPVMITLTQSLMNHVDLDYSNNTGHGPVGAGRRNPWFLLPIGRRLSWGLYVDILDDPQGVLSIDQVSSPEFQNRFQANEAKRISIPPGLGAVWIRFETRRDPGDKSPGVKRILEIANAILYRVDLYPAGPRGAGKIQGVHHRKSLSAPNAGGDFSELLL